jgi:hypothetical protein
MSKPTKGIVRGVNQAGRVVVDNTVKVRYKNENKRGPLVTMLTQLLNTFGSIFCPIKEKK